MAEAAEQSQSFKKWQEGILKNLQSLPSTEPPDCCIIVGTERIPVHKTALQLNSSLLTSWDVAYNNQSELFEIEVVPEFSKHFLLVSKIVNSFYTGDFDIVGENLIIVYKFAKCYSIQWMMDYVRLMLVDYIKEDEGCDRFVEILKSAQSICCYDLSDSCCELLDSELLDKISESDMISQFDFFTIKSVASSDKLKIPERDVFDFVVVWLKLNSSRCENFGAILESIQYQLIENDYLSDIVFDFVLDQPSLPNSSRKVILKKIKDSIRLPNLVGNTRWALTDSKLSDLNSSGSEVGLFSPNNDECLRKVALWMRGERKDGQIVISISNKELTSVLTDKFEFMVDNDQEVFVSYLCSYPYDIPWQLVSFPTISAIVTNSAILEHKRKCKKSKPGRDYHSIYSERFEGCAQVELIMLWALANPLQKAKIKQLLDTVCFRKIPRKYKENILIPSVMTIFPDITDLTCSHAHSEQNTGQQLIDMRVATAPAKIFLLQEFNDRLPGDKFCYRLSFSPENKSSCISLQSHEKGYQSYNWFLSESHAFILFDAFKPHFPKYPLFVRDCGLSAIEGIIKCSKELRFMFYKRTD